MRPILLIIYTSIDEHVNPAIKSQHVIIEMGPVDVLLREDGLINLGVTLLEFGVLA